MITINERNNNYGLMTRFKTKKFMNLMKKFNLKCFHIQKFLTKRKLNRLPIARTNVPIVN